MRKLLCLVVFCLLVVSASDAADPNCDGTIPVKGKCNGGVIPKAYWESEVCEGDKLGEKVCYNAIAFNQDDFTCSAPQVDPTRTPPSYMTYCVDNLLSVECTNLRTCSGVLMYREDGVAFTRCSQQGAMVPTFKLKKGTLTPTSIPIKCVETVPIP